MPSPLSRAARPIGTSALAATRATPEGPAPALAFDVRGVSKVYRTGETEVHALRGVDLRLFEREVVVLLSPSGSGKSTLLNILGGLDRPSGGTVFFKGVEL